MRSNKEQVLNIIDKRRFGEEPCPKRIRQIPELRDVGSFENLISKVNEGEIQLSIPNFKLFGDHEFVLTEKEKRIGTLFTYLPHLIALCFTVYGILNGYYWFALSLPIVIVAPAAYSFLSGLYALVILFNLSAFLFYVNKPTLAVISICIFISMITLRWLKSSKRSFLFDAALSDEAIFSYLFYNRTLSLFDNINNQIIYSQEDAIPDEETELKPLGLQPLEIQPTLKTPYVWFQPDGNLIIKGRYIPEDISEFSEQLMDWVLAYINSPAESTILTLEFEYINDASKYLLRIIQVLNKNCPNFTVEWFYEEGDDDMLELGEMIWNSSGAKFHFIEFE